MEPIVPDQLIVDALERLNEEALEQLRAERNRLKLPNHPPVDPGTASDWWRHLAA